MSYNLIDTSANGYALYNGSPFVEFDAGQTFLDILTIHFPALQFTSQVVSLRTGNGNRRECLFEISFNNSPGSTFYVYCFQTEGGGRAGLPNEGRIQWRQHTLWNPDLNTQSRADDFSSELANQNPDLTNKECYIFAFYKRNAVDNDIVISAVYPTQAQDVEINSVSPKSIQYQYPDIRDAFLNGISSTTKGNNELIIHFLPQHLIWYMINRDALHTGTLQQFQNAAAAQLQPPPIQAAAVPVPAAALPNDVPRNKIIYGAPGTGKSYELRQQALDIGFLNANTVRVTFHPNYSYQQFIGTYKPTPIYKTPSDAATLFYGSDKVTQLADPSNKEPLIDYSFVAGPLLSQLIDAINNPGTNYLIIVEEINRAAVSSVFGDVFQLLDRNDAGESEYEIEFNSDVSNYLNGKGIISKKIKLPANLFIWATMNSADQGVMPMDAAFKRRWAFEYLPLNAKEAEVANREISFQGTMINWNLFRSRLNDKLKLLGVSEDKLIGPFFLNAAELANASSIKNKLLLYLRDDVVRHNPENLFVQKAFSDIVLGYDGGSEIFNDVNFVLEQPAGGAEANA